MQELTPWGQNDHKNCEQKSQNHTGDLVNDLQRAGTKVTKATISNTLRRQGLKSCSARCVPLLKPVHVQAHLKFAREHLFGWSRRGLGECHMVRWNQNRTFWQKLNLSCLEEKECWVASKEHHTYCEAWGWKHHALGLFFCKGTRTTDLCKGKNERGHVSWDFEWKPPSISKGIEDETWLGLSAWQWSQTHRPGNEGVAS